jgi:hypothetical protein
MSKPTTEERVVMSTRVSPRTHGLIVQLAARLTVIRGERITMSDAIEEAIDDLHRKAAREERR